MKNWVLSNYGYHGFPKVGGCPFSKVLVSVISLWNLLEKWRPPLRPVGPVKRTCSTKPTYQLTTPRVLLNDVFTIRLPCGKRSKMGIIR